MTTQHDAATENRTVAEQVWSRNRRRMFGMAYRMLGSVTDAEDVLQDAYLRLAAADLDAVREPEAWLARVVSRLCLNRLTSARARREVYIGPWLPEPFVGSVEDSIDDMDSISAAFLVVLESLSPAQRVAFVMRELFGFGYADIADALQREETACRQLVSRARRHVAAHRPRFCVSPAQRRDVAAAFVDACRGGDLNRLLALLAPGAVALTDGGGNASAARRPVHGAMRVARLLQGVVARRPDDPMPLPAVHGLPGLAFVDDGGAVRWLLSCSVDDTGLVDGVFVLTNPAKLDHLNRRRPTGADGHRGSTTHGASRRQPSAPDVR